MPSVDPLYKNWTRAAALSYHLSMNRWLNYLSRWLPVVLIAYLAGCQLQAHEESTAMGKAHFKGYGCVNCHTVAGEGGVYGPDLTFVGFRKTKSWLDLWLKNPHGWKSNTVMPDFHLPDHVRGVLVEYLSSLQGDSYLRARPWDREDIQSDPVKRGEMVFSRVGCAGCHGPRGVGGYPNNNVAGGKIPTLTRVAEGFSEEELLTKIRVGVPKSAKEDPNGPDPMIHMPAWGQKLNESEISALADYLISLKPKTTGDEW